MDYISELKKNVADTVAHPDCVLLVKRSDMDALLVEHDRVQEANRGNGVMMEAQRCCLVQLRADNRSLLSSAETLKKAVEARDDHANAQHDIILKLRKERQQLQDENARLNAIKPMTANVWPTLAVEAPGKFLASDDAMRRLREHAAKNCLSSKDVAEVLKELDFRRRNAFLREERRKNRVDKFGEGVQVLVDGERIDVARLSLTKATDNSVCYGINAVRFPKIVEPVGETVTVTKTASVGKTEPFPVKVFGRPWVNVSAGETMTATAKASGGKSEACRPTPAKNATFFDGVRQQRVHVAASHNGEPSNRSAKSPAELKLDAHRDQAAKYAGAPGTGGAPEAIVAIIDYLLGRA